MYTKLQIAFLDNDHYVAFLLLNLSAAFDTINLRIISHHLQH